MKNQKKQLGKLQLNVLSSNEMASTKGGGLTSHCWGATRACIEIKIIITPAEK